MNSYGVDPKRKGRVEEHDGIMAIHAIMSCFKQTDTLYRNDVRDIIYSSYPKFGQGDPRSVIKLLRKKFAEANEVCEPINSLRTVPRALFKEETVLFNREHNSSHRAFP